MQGYNLFDNIHDRIKSDMARTNHSQDLKKKNHDNNR